MGHTEGFILRTFVSYNRDKQNLMSLNYADEFFDFVVVFLSVQLLACHKATPCSLVAMLDK